MTPDQITRGREELGLSKTALARAIGSTRVSVSKWERGHCTPMPIYARRLARLFSGEVGVADEDRLAITAPIGTAVQGPDGSWGRITGLGAEGVLVDWT
jgi:DNA-binding XRE family transcriptional regulator